VKRPTRHCRICGQLFRPVRFDALTCTDPCRLRKSRHPEADLAYLATLPPAEAMLRRIRHETEEGEIAIGKSVGASRREGRAQRRGMPKPKRMSLIRPSSVKRSRSRTPS
jgi:hypothetical protein